MHTSGPWFYPPANDSFDDMDVMVSGPAGQICQLPEHPGLTRNEAKANAHLIAASPELLVALKAITEKMAALYPEEKTCVSAARSAIAKAEEGSC